MRLFCSQVGPKLQSTPASDLYINGGKEVCVHIFLFYSFSWQIFASSLICLYYYLEWCTWVWNLYQQLSILLQLDSLNLCVSCGHTALRVIHDKITLFHLCFVFSSDQNMCKFFKALCYWISFLRPSGRAIHVSQISTQIYGGIPRDHPCGNCLMISLRKFGGKWRGIFYMDISASFPCGNFPRASLKNFKMQFNYMYIGRVPVTPDRRGHLKAPK